MLNIDGSVHEGGGQVLRNALALSTLTGIPFRITKIRASRPKPGLKAQHINCVKALVQLCSAKHSTLEIGAEELEYIPGKIKGCTVNIDIGTAGSITLLMQSVLLPAFFAPSRVRFRVIGGTDVSWSMPVDYFNMVFLPYLQRFGTYEFQLLKRGYYPKGQGSVELRIKPKISISEFNSFNEFLSYLRDSITPFDLSESKDMQLIKGVSHASIDLEKASVAERQATAAKLSLNQIGCPVDIETQYSKTESTGSVITVFGISENNIRIGSDFLGKRGLKADVVGRKAAEQLVNELKDGAVVDVHLADNLIPFIALTKGSLRTSRITGHIRAAVFVAEQFLPVKFKIDEKNCIVEVI